MGYKVYSEEIKDIASMSCNYTSSSLHSDEFVELFFKLYKEAGYCNKLEVSVFSAGLPNIKLSCDPMEELDDD